MAAGRLMIDPWQPGLFLVTRPPPAGMALGRQSEFSHLYNCTNMIALIMEIVIDTSALLAVVALEPERAELIRLSQGATLIAPSSIHWETGNALSAMFKRKAIELDDALKVLDAYAVIPIRLIDPPLQQAARLCQQLNIYAYDAYVIACAINQRAPILSLDNVLKERARSLKLAILEVKAA